MLAQRAKLVSGHRCRAHRARWRQQLHAREAIGADIWERVQHHRIDDREEAGAGGDADVKDRDRGCGKASIAPQVARGVAQVVRQHGERPDDRTGTRVPSGIAGLGGLPSLL